jgi:hypothetical protein
MTGLWDLAARKISFLNWKSHRCPEKETWSDTAKGQDCVGKIKQYLFAEVTISPEINFTLISERLLSDSPETCIRFARHF